MRPIEKSRTGKFTSVSRIPWVWFILLAAVLYLPLYSTLNLEDADLDQGDVYSRHEQSTAVRKAAFVVVGVSGMISLTIGGFRRLRWSGSIGILIGLTFFWAAASLLWSDSVHAAARRLFVMALFFVGSLAMAARWPRDLIIRFIMFSCAVHLGMNLAIELASGRFLPLESGYRFRGSLDPNTLGITCVFLILSALVASRPPSRNPKVFLVIAFCGLALLLLTRSRTSLAGLLAGLAIYWHLVLPARRKWAGVFLVVMFLLVSLLVLGELFLGLLPDVALLGRESDQARTLTGRIPLWNECLDFASARPIHGYGFNSFWTPEKTYDVSHGAGWVATRAHSAYLELMLTVGLAGLCLYLALVAAVFRRALRLFRRTRAPEFAFAAAVVVVYLVVGTLESFIMITSYSSVAFYASAIVLYLAFSSEADSAARNRDDSANPQDWGMHRGA